jgi:hypothetical protein
MVYINGDHAVAAEDFLTCRTKYGEKADWPRRVRSSGGAARRDRARLWPGGQPVSTVARLWIGYDLCLPAWLATRASAAVRAR